MRIIVLALTTNLALYMFMLFGNNIFPFHKHNYLYNAHHYFEDPRIKDGSFRLLRVLGVYDSQWYLKIADKGYPKNPTTLNNNNKTIMEGLSYAFFPLFPFLLSLLNYFINNIELTAFLFNNILFLINCCSIYYIISKVFSKTLALKTTILFIIFPFSIFFRSYFAEGLFLFLLLWFTYFLKEKKFMVSAIFLSLLYITKGNSFLLYFLYLYRLTQTYTLRKFSNATFFSLLVLPFLGTAVWFSYCFLQTGNFLYFMSVRHAWSPYGIEAFFLNIYNLMMTPFLRLHSFHSSQVDNVMFLLSIFLLTKAKRILPNEFLWANILLLSVYFIGQDLISFSRNTSIFFPIFIYLAYILKGKLYVLILLLFSVSLSVITLLFINWYWIG